jgi:hypothetical protein
MLQNRLLLQEIHSQKDIAQNEHISAKQTLSKLQNPTHTILIVSKSQTQDSPQNPTKTEI